MPESQIERFQFIVRELYPGEENEELKRLVERLRPHAEMVPGVLSDEEYNARLIDSDVIVAPYRSKDFGTRTSAVFASAIAFAKAADRDARNVGR